MGALVAVGVLVIVAVVAGSGDDDETPVTAASAMASYCELAEAFDRVVQPTASDADPESTSAAAIGRRLEQMGDKVEELKQRAPGRIRSDVAATVKAVQDAAKGDTAAIRSESFKSQSERIATFRNQMCIAEPVTGD